MTLSKRLTLCCQSRNANQLAPRIMLIRSTVKDPPVTSKAINRRLVRREAAYRALTVPPGKGQTTRRQSSDVRHLFALVFAIQYSRSPVLAYIFHIFSRRLSYDHMVL